MTQLLQSWEACVFARDLLNVKGQNHLPKTILQSSVGIYLPQTKFVKVMFLHRSVSHSVHRGGVCLSACWDTQPPGSRHPLLQQIPWDQTPPVSRHPPEQTPLEADICPGNRHPSCTVHAGRYGQQSGGTHPTKMDTCPKVNIVKNPLLLLYLCTIAMHRRRVHSLKSVVKPVHKGRWLHLLGQFHSIASYLMCSEILLG